MKPTTNRGGRPRSFDRSLAVKTAMSLFRRHGYEGVSLAMLTEAIGIAPPSIYAAFGSKAGLFHEALDRYAETMALSLLPQGNASVTLDHAISSMFDRAIQSVTASPGERGCMISTGLLGCHPDHGDLAEALRIRRAALVEQFACELGRWLPPHRCVDMAAFLCAVLQGVAVQARDGASVESLRMIAANARSCLAR